MVTIHGNKGVEVQISHNFMLVSAEPDAKILYLCLCYVHVLYRSRVSWGRRNVCSTQQINADARIRHLAGGRWLVLVLVLGVRGAALECGVKRAPQIYYR